MFSSLFPKVFFWLHGWALLDMGIYKEECVLENSVLLSKDQRDDMSLHAT